MEEQFFLDSEYTEIDQKTKAQLSASIKNLKANVGKKTIFKALCIKSSKDGNLTLLINGVECFMLRDDVSPIYELDGHVHKNKAFNLVGKTIECTVKELVEDTIYMQRKTLITKLRVKYRDKIQNGTKMHGTVVNINHNGVFVDIGADFTALIPKKNIEHIFVADITDYINIGDTVTGVVTDVTYTEENSIDKVILSRKALLPTIDELKSNYAVGDILLSSVKSISLSGIYVHIGEHLDMLCNFKDNIKYEIGQKVKVKITKISNRIDGEIL